jgi:hypothetical protein
MSAFDYGQPAEVYYVAGRRDLPARRTGLAYRRFGSAAQAVRFVMERPRPLVVATIEAGDDRFELADIELLYLAPAYPLDRGRPVV